MTIKVSVRTFATFKEVFGDNNEVEVREGATVPDALRALCTMKKTGFDTLFSENGALKEHVILALNGTRIEVQDSGKMRVSGGDTIAAYPPVSGG